MLRYLPYLVAALLAGSVQALSFTSRAGGWLQLASLAALLLIWQRRAIDHVRRAAALGWCFGLGWFACGLYWMYISMHDYGGMPAPVAALALLLFCAYLALFPAATLALVTRLRIRRRDAAPGSLDTADMLALAGLWTWSEWLRGQLFTGFPWLASGYAHVDGPLAGWAPVLGVFGISGLAMLCAAATVRLAVRFAPRTADPAAHLPRRGARLACALWLALPLVAGALLSHVDWSRPSGRALNIRLTQGSVPQEMKFDPRRSYQAMQAYARMVHEPSALSPLDLAVMPETAWTVPWSATPPEMVERLLPEDAGTTGAAMASPAYIALGAPMPPLPGSLDYDPPSPGQYEIANSMLVLKSRPPAEVRSQAPAQVPARIPGQALGQVQGQVQGLVLGQYDKHHLVPFGEFIPTGFGWFVRLMNIPLGSFTRGAPDQPPMEIAGQRVAFDICYENLFGEEIIPSVRDGAATILINASNLGWFGDSVALPQHLQIARMRAMETARPMLQATNTGVTAFIDSHGHVRKQLPVFAEGVLDDRVQGMQGLTPYVRLGNGAALLLAGLAVLAGLLNVRMRARRQYG